MTFTPLVAGTVVAGKLQIVRVLGTGGMGAVYEVVHLFTKHRRALKLLHPELSFSSTFVERFLREASAAGHIGNEHIVETFDAGRTEEGTPYVVMELLSGRVLSSVIAERQRLPFAEAVEVFGQICDGVQAAHDAGIVHRDLKPENVFLREGEHPFVKILDFGISKFDPSLTGARSSTVEGTMMGTPFYMSPEQVRGARDLDARADVYALGIVLYESVTGRRPFDAETLPELSILIHEGKYTPASTLCPDLPGGLDAVIAWAVSADRAARPQSVRELGEAVRRLAGTPPAAPRTLIVEDAATSSTIPALMAPAPAPALQDVRALAPSGTEAPRTAPAVSVPVIPSGSGERARPPEQAPPARNRGLVVGVVVGLALAVTALAVLTSGGPSTPAVTGEPRGVGTAATVSGAAPAPVPVPSSATLVLPLAGSAASSAPTAAPSAISTAGAAHPTPAAVGPKKSVTPAGKHGLAEENPF